MIISIAAEEIYNKIQNPHMILKKTTRNRRKLSQHKIYENPQ